MRLKKLLLGVCFFLLLGIIFLVLQYFKYSDIINQYNETVSDYNVVAKSYIEELEMTSVDNIADMPVRLTYKVNVDDGLDTYLSIIINDLTLKNLQNDYELLKNEIEILVQNYLIVEQITNPSAEWVMACLDSVGEITGVQMVETDNDPLGFLDMEGGYTGCVYFTVSSIDQNIFEGNDIVSKGTDSGGSIEIFKNKEDAAIRCEYLSQFDNTLLYSGSYAIIGTMVVRTSCYLSDAEQLELTGQITNALTKPY